MPGLLTSHYLLQPSNITTSPERHYTQHAALISPRGHFTCNNLQLILPDYFFFLRYLTDLYYQVIFSFKFAPSDLSQFSLAETIPGGLEVREIFLKVNLYLINQAVFVSVCLSPLINQRHYL